MNIQRIAQNEDCEFLLTGRVDGDAAHELEVQVLAAIREGFKRILINLAGTTFLCSAALRVLLQHHRQMKSQGKTLLVSRVSPEADAILELTGFRDQILEKH